MVVKFSLKILFVLDMLVRSRWHLMKTLQLFLNVFL